MPKVKRTRRAAFRLCGERVRLGSRVDLALPVAHAEEADDIQPIEGVGAANFLSLDDIPLGEEGEEVDAASVVELPFEAGFPVFRALTAGDPDSPLVRRIESSGKKWVVITDESGEPRLVLESDGFVRGFLFRPENFVPLSFCHRPILATDPAEPLGRVLSQLWVQPRGPRRRRGGSRRHSAVGASTPGDHGSRSIWKASTRHRRRRAGAKR